MHTVNRKLLATSLALQAASLLGCSEKLPNFKVLQLPTKVEITSGPGDSGGGGGGGACALGSQLSVSSDLNAPGTGGVAKSNIIFVVDTSGSMNDEMIKLQVNLPAFINQLNAQLDSNHKVVLHASVSGWSLPGVYLHNKAVGSVNKLAKIEEALGIVATTASNVMPVSALFREAGTIFHYVVVTDDVEVYGGCSPTASGVSAVGPYSASSVANYEACLIGRYGTNVGGFMASHGFSHRFHAIHFKNSVTAPVGCAVGTAAQTSLSETGAPYISMAQAFGGGSHDLCQENWNQLLTSLVDQISSAAQSQRVQLTACSSSNVLVQRVVIKQGSYSRVLSGGELSSVIFHQGTSSAASTVQLQSSFLQQLISSGDIDGQGYTLRWSLGDLYREGDQAASSCSASAIWM